MNVSTSTVGRTAVPSAGQRPDAAAASSTSPRATRGVAHLPQWTYRPGAEGLLDDVAPSAWTDPAAAGWTRVKENARRDVWRFTHGGRVYYIKYYFRDTWRDFLSTVLRAPPFKAEWDSGVYAARAQIAAVLPIACMMDITRQRQLDGHHITSRCAALVTEGLEPAMPLSDFWLHLAGDDDARRRREDQSQIIERLAEVIARAHQAGFEHRDMHAANILVQTVGPRRYRTALVDLHSAHRGTPVSDHAVVRNLAQLNQWFRRHATIGDRLRFLRAYLRVRGNLEPLFDTSRALRFDFRGLVRALDAAARRHLEHLGRRRDHRVGRDGRYFSRIGLGGGWHGVVTRSTKHASDESRASQLEFTRDWWRERFRDPPAWFAQVGDEACKHSHSAVVRRALLEHPGGAVPVILKRPTPRNWRRTLVQMFSGSRSRRAWHTAFELLNRDVAAARPLAWFERRLGPLVMDSVSVIEAVPGAVDLEQFLRREQGRRTPQAWANLKRVLLPRAARHVRRLHDRGYDHRDCKASNILVVEHPSLKLLWIDMDGIRAARWGAVRSRKSLVRLHVSLLEIPGITRTDRARFLRCYLARFGASGTAWRREFRLIDAEARQKLGALERRRAWKLRHYGRT